MRMVLCISSATAKVALFAGCWRYHPRRLKGKTAAELLAHSPMALFDELGLRAQLSASRTQGLHALNEAILEAARQV